MGQVFLGRSPGGRLVALKVIRSELTDEPGFRERFRREAVAMKAVSGAYTAPVIDADADGDPAWLATAFIDAPALSDAVRSSGPLPPERVQALAAGLAEALWAIHREGLTHRDLKPGNVLLAADGPRVIDFGLAVTAENSALTRSGVVIGTPAYMAPEQISGRGATPASDIFALGAVLVFAATGRAPFGDGAPVELVYRIVHDEPAVDDLPAAVREAVRACLRKEPQERPTPQEVLRILNGDTVPLAPPSAAAPEVTVAAATAVLPPGADDTTHRLHQASESPSPAPTTSAAEPRRQRAKTRALIAGAALTAAVAVTTTAVLLLRDGSAGSTSSGGTGGNTTGGGSHSGGTAPTLTMDQLFTTADAAAILQVQASNFQDSQPVTADTGTPTVSETWATRNTLGDSSIRVAVSQAATVSAAQALYGPGRAGTQPYQLVGADAAEVTPVGPDDGTRHATVIFRVSNIVVSIDVYETLASPQQTQADAETAATTVASRIPLH
jgi:serine/threonine protein kinase